MHQGRGVECLGGLEALLECVEALDIERFGLEFVVVGLLVLRVWFESLVWSLLLDCWY